MTGIQSKKYFIRNMKKKFKNKILALEMWLTEESLRTTGNTRGALICTREVNGDISSALK